MAESCLYIPIWFYFNPQLSVPHIFYAYLLIFVDFTISVLFSHSFYHVFHQKTTHSLYLHTIVDLFAFLFYRTSTEFFIINLHHLQIQFYNIPFHHIDIAYAIVFIIKYNFIILGLYLFFYFLHLFTDLLYTLIVSVVPHWNVKSIINFHRINSCSTLEFLIAKVKQVSISLTGIIGVTEKSAHGKCTLFSVTPPLYPFFHSPIL